MPYAGNYKGGDRTAGNTVAIQPRLGDFPKEIIVVCITEAEKGVRRV